MGLPAPLRPRPGLIPALVLIWCGGIICQAAERAPRRDLFEQPGRHKIQIELSAGALRSLQIDPRKDVPAVVRAGGRVFSQVALHLKGSGTFQPIDGDKPSFTLDFGQFVPERRWGTVGKIHLNNSMDDPSYVKECLGSELFRAAGLPAPRVAHALVQLNGRSLGVYVVKESVTDLLARFSGEPGSLDAMRTGPDGRRSAPSSGGFGLATAADLERLASAAADPDAARRWQQLGALIDLDQFVSFMALEIMLAHWDGYCLNQNNFGVYRAEASGKLAFLPAGMDQILGKPDLTWQPDMTGLLARVVMETPIGRQRYQERFRTLFQRHFISRELTNRACALLGGLRPLFRSAAFGEARQEALELCARIEAREAHLRAQMETLGADLPRFDRGRARVTAWERVNPPEGGLLEENVDEEGTRVLRILAGPRTSASWRGQVWLGPGRYRFQAKVRVEGVQPLPFGERQGACLRVAGLADRSDRLLGTRPWQALEATFVLERAASVVLICELRASRGEACFQKDSLVLTREE